MMIPSYTTIPDSRLSPGQVADKFSGESLAGLGALGTLGCGCNWMDDFGQCIDLEPCDSTTTLNYPGMPTGPVSYDGGPVRAVATTPAGGGYNYAPVIAATTQGLLDIAKLNSIQPGTVQTARGTTRQTAGYAVPVSSTNLGITTNASGTILMVGIGLVAAVLLLGGKKGNG